MHWSNVNLDAGAGFDPILDVIYQILFDSFVQAAFVQIDLVKWQTFDDGSHATTNRANNF